MIQTGIGNGCAAASAALRNSIMRGSCGAERFTPAAATEEKGRSNASRPFGGGGDMEMRVEGRIEMSETAYNELADDLLKVFSSIDYKEGNLLIDSCKIHNFFDDSDYDDDSWILEKIAKAIEPGKYGELEIIEMQIICYFGGKDYTWKEGEIVYPPNPFKKKAVQDEIPLSMGQLVIDYLNEKTGSNFKPESQKALRFITARAREGYSFEDFKAVIDYKCEQWMEDPRMKDYLRPQTLFNVKFEFYYQEARDKRR